MVLSPMTRISTVRRTLEGIDTQIPWHEFWFSLDGENSLPETSTMWDLNIFSNTAMVLSESAGGHMSCFCSDMMNGCLENRYLSLTVHLRGGPEEAHLGLTYHINAEEDELVEGLKQRVYLESGIPPLEQLLLLRDNVLQDHLTLKQEGLHGGENIDVINLDVPETFTSEG